MRTRRVEAQSIWYAGGGGAWVFGPGQYSGSRPWWPKTWVNTRENYPWTSSPILCIAVSWWHILYKRHSFLQWCFHFCQNHDHFLVFGNLCHYVLGGEIHSRCPWMIRRVCWCLVMTVFGGPPRAFGRSPDKAVILQSLLSDEFPDWKVGGLADGGGRFRLSRGVTVGAPRAAQRVLIAVPLVPVVVFTPSASVFPPPKFGGVTGVHWMDWVVSIQWLQWSCTCLPAPCTYFMHALVFCFVFVF